MCLIWRHITMHTTVMLVDFTLEGHIRVNEITGEPFLVLYSDSIITRLFVGQSSRANSKGNVKTPHYWSFVRRHPPVKGGSPHKRQVMRENLPCLDANISIYICNRENIVITLTVSSHTIFDMAWFGQHIEAETKWSTCWRRHFQSHLFECNFF